MVICQRILIQERQLKFIVIQQHQSEFPDPITFSKGALLNLGEVYKGEEGWKNWCFCTTQGQKGGWVPEQVFERIDDNIGCAIESYTARELDVDQGDVLLSLRELNGWVWCRKSTNGEEGWVPAECLQQIDS